MDAPVSLTGLLHAAPNPITASVGGTLRFQLAEATVVSLEIVDVQGRVVSRLVDGLHPAGQHAVRWSGEDWEGRPVPGGIYFQRFRAGSVEQSEKLVVIR
jgi:flagellar hook assembly protein FlgD